MDEKAKERAREQSEIMTRLLTVYLFGSKTQDRMPVFLESMVMQSLSSIITYINTGQEKSLDAAREVKTLVDFWATANGGSDNLK
ncbi:MAG: hypothetical protein IJP88_12135 [Synergistaceae bacterium]|nr:hypothetical protein [Synergistaceae bacterium]MBR0097926.1 hypothetical protein [Synergistaceae bacterium]